MSALAPELHPVPSEQVCTTLGVARPSGDGFVVEDTKLRATLAGSQGQGVELEFRYLGPTELMAPLRSGSERRQLGLELRARDTCNLVYVMWRIEPDAMLTVSVKRNGAQRTHAECQNRGYRRLRPAFSAPVPRLSAGSLHRLRAEVIAEQLRVFVDDRSVWQGPLDATALALAGRSGLRSDNVRFEVLALRADLIGTRAECASAGSARDQRSPDPAHDLIK
jgi:hypothetical protein